MKLFLLSAISFAAKMPQKDAASIRAITPQPQQPIKIELTLKLLKYRKSKSVTCDNFYKLFN